MALLTLLQESKVFGDFYVPRFEIRVSGAGLPATVLRDVIKVTYSDDIKKLDNFELTVNNWDATTREFKYVGAETLASLGIRSDPTQKQKINPLHRIFEPTSNKVEVFLGYGGTLKLMLSGIFTTIEPNFPSSSASTLTVRGLNVLHALRTKQRTQVFPEKKESEIAKSFERLLPDPDNVGQKLKILINPPAPPNAEAPIPYVAQDNQYDIDFLFERARQAGYELFIQEQEKKGAKVIKERGLYFGPSDSAHASLGSDVLELKWGISLIDFKPTLTTANQIGTVVLNGWNVLTKKKIVGRASIKDIKLNRDLHGLLKNPDAREEHVVDEPVFNQAQADRRAKAILLGRMKDLVKASGTCIGLPGLRAGQRVRIGELGARFSGEYFVTSTTHTLDDSGYITKFNARREEKQEGAEQ